MTIIGGFRRRAYTDTIQTVIMIVGCGLMLFIGLHEVGGWQALAAKVPQAMHIAKPYDDPNYPFWGIIAGADLRRHFLLGHRPGERAARAGLRRICNRPAGERCSPSLLKLTPVFIFALPGVIALALYPGAKPKTTFVTLLNELLPSGARGLVLAALLAALIASMLSVMNSISTMVVRDFVLHFRPRTSERAQVCLAGSPSWVAPRWASPRPT